MAVSASTVIDVRLYLQHAAGDEKRLFLAFLCLHPDFPGLQPGQHRSMARCDTDFTHLGGGEHHRCRTRKDFGFSADDIDVQGHCHVIAPLQGLRFLGDFVDAADHVEGLFRQMVVFTVHNTLETGNGVLQ